jgi:hypothetical protein
MQKPALPSGLRINHDGSQRLKWVIRKLTLVLRNLADKLEIMFPLTGEVCAS